MSRLSPKDTKISDKLLTLSIQLIGLAFLFHKISCLAKFMDQFWAMWGSRVGELSMTELICEPESERV